jgi:hypothetical protein
VRVAKIVGQGGEPSRGTVFFGAPQAPERTLILISPEIFVPETAYSWLEDSADMPATPAFSQVEREPRQDPICLFHGQVSKSGTIHMAQYKLPRGGATAN